MLKEARGREKDEGYIVYCDECRKKIGGMESLTIDAWGNMDFVQVSFQDTRAEFCSVGCLVKNGLNKLHSFM